MTEQTTPGAPVGEVAADVAIVGAGPVGQVLAVLLAARGWRVDILERQAEPYPLPRAVHIDHEACRILQAAGVMAELEPLTEVMDAYEWQTAGGETLLRFGVEGVLGQSGWPESVMFSQPDLERVLAARLATLPSVTLRRGCEVVGLTQDEDSVHLAVRNVGGALSARRARWVIGCDGAQATVGKMLGVRQEDLGYSSAWLVLDVLPDEIKPWHPMNVQVCNPLRPTTAVSGGPGRRRWEFMALPGEAAAELAGRSWELLEPWGMTPGNATLERQAVYTFSAAMAEAWVVGRVALAGDAAHLMPPFAGQGLCSGLRDAVNLAWKLDLMLVGAAPAGLLATYGGERAPQVRTIIDFSIDLGRIICVSDLAEAAARDEAMVAAARHSGAVPLPPPPPIGPGVTLAGDAQAGQLGWQGVVAHRGRRGRFDDVVAQGWVLLSAGPDPLAGVDPALRRWWHELGGVSVHVAAVTAGSGAARPGSDGAGDDIVVHDIDGTYARWFEETGASIILQRPDFYVFGTATNGDGAEALLRAARAASTTPNSGG